MLKLIVVPSLALALGACAMQERTNVITARGNPLTLEGAPVKVGQKAPDFQVVSNDMKDKSLKDYAGKVLIICSVPSLDTGVCSKETHTFNQRAADLSDDVEILTISRDLPFAMARWCGAEGVDRVVTLSDYKSRSFGERYGLAIKENALLARAVYVVNRDGVITYEQIVPELTSEPDYDAAIAAAKAAL